MQFYCVTPLSSGVYSRTSFPAVSFMKPPLLTFAVPTYNRPREIERLLGRAVPQLAEFPGEVDVLIKDDSTNDDSEKAARAILDKYKVPYSYARGKKEGIDPANIYLAQHAKGDFVWWFGDDDELLPGSVAKVLSAIKKHPDAGFIWLNLVIDGGRTAIPAGEEKLLKSGDEFLENVGIDMTLLSTGIFRREAALPALPIAKKYIGTHFASQPFIFEAVSSGRETVVIAEPCLVNHPTEMVKGQNLFWDGVTTMGVGYYDILLEFRGRFGHRAIRKVLARNFGHIWRGLIIGWIRRDTEPPRRRIGELMRYWSYGEFYVAAPLFLLPKCAVRALLKMYKLVFKKSYLEP